MIKIPRGVKVVVVGDIHEHEEQVDKLLKEVTPSTKMILASVGDIYDKGYGEKSAESIVDKFSDLIDKGVAYVVRGNHELKCIRLAKKKKKMTKHLAWMAKQPLSISFEFCNRTRLVIVHGGVSPGHTADDLKTDIATCYIRQLDENGKRINRVRKVVDEKLFMEDEKPGGKVWHEVYDGRFGYIASGHAAQLDGVPKFYNYSCNLDTAVYNTGKLTAQIFSEKGKEELLIFDGEAKYPDFKEMQRLMAKGRI
ncbi:hypothetical protein LCGC14_0459240 [marine sediment metagenome]|uniref:Calcineurin-like phosphoesterase domain-containing protein n=1 Tax=marine sediment metagenome TaxID=412755 RepID=A0A0F9SFJ9_9ZZZZ